MNNLVMGVLAIVAIVIVALALSGTNKTVATIIQAGLVIAIVGVLLRDTGNQQVFFKAWKQITSNAIGTTGKQSSS